ncbi:MAG: hypothetical protein U0R81_13360 [Mycobacterium sp.]
MSFSNGFAVRGSAGTAGSAGSSAAARHDSAAESKASQSRARLVVNWTLALASLLGAAGVVIVAYERFVGIDCDGLSCPGPGDFWFTFITRGAPISAVVAVGVSGFTANKRLGFLVPLVTWMFLVFCFAAVVVAFP